MSVAGNVGHVTALPGQAVTVADRITAAVSPVAAFAGLMIGLLVLKMSQERTADTALGLEPPVAAKPLHVVGGESRHDLVEDAARLMDAAEEGGKFLSQRTLAAQLRELGHRFSNDQLRASAAMASDPELRRVG